MTIEIVGGVVAGSLAILTDAAHMLSDVAGFIILECANHFQILSCVTQVRVSEL